MSALQMSFYCRLFLRVIFSFGKYLHNTIKFYHFWFIPSYNIPPPYLLTVYSGATKWVSEYPGWLTNLDGGLLTAITRNL